MAQRCSRVFRHPLAWFSQDSHPHKFMFPRLFVGSSVKCTQVHCKRSLSQLIPPFQRYYVSKEYLLPADEEETCRLNLQHRILTRAFDNRLSLAPLKLKTGDRILESAAGTGIWTLAFQKGNRGKGVVLDIECCDISDRQFPLEYPSNIHLTLRSIMELPAEWKETFSYVHQRLLYLALNGSRWQKTIGEMFRVLRPGGWVELVEFEARNLQFGIGPHSQRLVSLINTMYADNGVVQDLAEYLPSLLEKTGFTDISCVSRKVSIGKSGEHGYLSSQWRDAWAGMKGPMLRDRGLDIVKTQDELDILLQNSEIEWDRSNEASATFYTILAKKPYH